MMTQGQFTVQWHKGSPCIEARTSGSTGTPKVIMLRRADMLLSARRTVAFFNLSSASHLHSCIDFQYIGGKMMAVRADVAACRLTSETPSNHPLQEFGPNDRIDLLSVVPSQTIYMLDHPERMPQLGAVLIGGAPIPPGLRQRLARSPLPAWETYGMTETCSHIALRRVASDPTLPFQTLPGIKVSPGPDGVLTIYGATSDGCGIVTNDLAAVQSPEHFTITGRADNTIVTGGKKVQPESLEEKISSLCSDMDIPTFAITSVPDPKWGEAVTIVFETGGSGSRAQLEHQVIDRLMAALRNRLLPEEYPRKVSFLHVLPQTPNGKTDRKALSRSVRDNMHLV